MTAEEWADDFAQLIRHLDLPSAHILGSSHGGSMAMAMALRHPSVVASLLLFGAFSELDRFIVLDFWIPAKFSKIIAKAIPHSAYVDMPECGHIAVRDDPEGSARIIKEFLVGRRLAKAG